MTELATQACPLCGAADFETVQTFDSGVVVGECSSCSFIYTPLQDPDPGSVLAGDAENDLDLLFGPILEGRVRHYRHAAYSQYLDELDRRTSGRRLLDVGCAHGFFPAQAKARGWTATAVELQPELAAFASRVHGIEVLPGSIQDVDLGDREFDAVTFTDSLEYVPDPVRALERVHAHLAPGGLLLAKVPNADYFRLGMAAARAGVTLGETAFGPEQRVSHFTKESLTRTASAAGYNAIEVSAFPPIHSVPWYPIVGLQLAAEPPRRLNPGKRFVRNALHRAGRLEDRLVGRNHGSQSLLLIARA